MMHAISSNGLSNFSPLLRFGLGFAAICLLLAGLYYLIQAYPLLGELVPLVAFCAITTFNIFAWAKVGKRVQKDNNDSDNWRTVCYPLFNLVPAAVVALIAALFWHTSLPRLTVATTIFCAWPLTAYIGYWLATLTEKMRTS